MDDNDNLEKRLPLTQFNDDTTIEGVSYVLRTPVFLGDFGKGIVSKASNGNLEMYLNGNSISDLPRSVMYAVKAEEYGMNVVEEIISERENPSEFRQLFEELMQTDNPSQDLVYRSKLLSNIEDPFDEWEDWRKEKFRFSDINSVDTGNIRMRTMNDDHGELAREHGVENYVLGGFHYFVPLIGDKPTFVAFDTSQRFGSVKGYEHMEEYFLRGTGIESGLRE